MSATMRTKPSFTLSMFRRNWNQRTFQSSSSKRWRERRWWMRNIPWFKSPTIDFRSRSLTFQVTLEHFQRQGFSTPLFIAEKSGLHMTVRFSVIVGGLPSPFIQSYPLSIFEIFYTWYIFLLDVSCGNFTNLFPITNVRTFFTIAFSQVPDSSFDISDVRSLVGGKRIIEVDHFWSSLRNEKYVLGDELGNSTELRDDVERLGGVLHAPRQGRHQAQLHQPRVLQHQDGGEGDRAQGGQADRLGGSCLAKVSFFLAFSSFSSFLILIDNS